MPVQLKPAKRTLALSLLMSAAAPAAFAQAVATANAAPTGISQEQFLALMGRLDALERRNSELEAQVAALKAGSGATAEAVKQQAKADTVTMANGRPTFASRDGRFSASLRGLVQLDAARYDQDSAGTLASDFRRGSYGSAEEADRARDLADGANFRRVRFGIEGKAFSDWAYNLLFDFGGSGTEEAGRIINAYLEYGGLDAVRLRVGAFAPPSNLDDATSSSSTLFIERAAVAELVRGLAASDGRVGAAALAGGDRWSFSAAVTGNLVGAASFDDQLGFVSRATWAPVKDDGLLVHVGANANLVINPPATGPDAPPGGAPTPVRLRERPEMRVDPTRLVDTGSIDADGLSALGLELAAQLRNLSVQGEHFWIDVDRRTGALADPSFSGWYLQGAWTLTGEPRRYNGASGAFDTPRPAKPFSLKSGDWGAWELAARYSVLDLDFRASAPDPSAVRGGEQRIFSVGLNWYPNANVRFLADYQRVDVDRLSPGGTAFGAGALTPPAGVQIGQELNIWSIRTQYAF